MSNPNITYRIFPLGDFAVTIDFGNIIDEVINEEIVARFNQLQGDPIPGMVELVPSYSSLTVYYDVGVLNKKIKNTATVFEWIKNKLEEKLHQSICHKLVSEKIIRIPVCYEEPFSPDIKIIAAANKISVEEIIQVHVAKQYKVYMLGFLPGFPYLGEVDQRIAIPRKGQPQNVAAGSVGIAGRQTGIYPFASPGGWQIIGRTPIKLFDAAKENPTLLRAGEAVQFYSITTNEFKNY